MIIKMRKTATKDQGKGKTETLQHLKFTVPGTPVPYLRMTRGQVKLLKVPEYAITDPKALKIRTRVRRVLEYKEWVRANAILLKYDGSPKGKTILNVMCYFANNKHGDPENCRKLIQDSLFADDKKVVGTVDFMYDNVNPRCEIEIIELGENWNQVTINAKEAV